MKNLGEQNVFMGKIRALFLTWACNEDAESALLVKKGQIRDGHKMNQVSGKQTNKKTGKKYGCLHFAGLNFFPKVFLSHEESS